MSIPVSYTHLGDEHSDTNGIAYDGSAIVIDSYIGYAGEMNLTISGESQIISDYSTAIHEIGNTACLLYTSSCKKRKGPV